MGKVRLDRTIIMHVDVNSAYLSWSAAQALENGSNIDYREIAAIVGGDPKTRRGIVLAKSLPAKRYGIKTAETLYSALKKCPHLKIIAPDYQLYMNCSAALKQLLATYSPYLQRFSVDEFFVDFSSIKACQKDPVAFAHKLKDDIYQQLGFTVNVGISSNKLLAKIAGDFEKPNKVHTLFKNEIATKLWPLPIGDLYMVGRRTLPKLQAMGINTVGDLAMVEPQLIATKLKKFGLVLRKLANGEVDNFISAEPNRPVKGIGNSTTMAFDITDSSEALMVLLSLTEMVCLRLRAKVRLAGTVAISIKAADFTKLSHQTKLSRPTDDTSAIYQTVRQLFSEVWHGQPIRLLGVRLSNLTDCSHYQLSLLDYQTAEKRHQLNQTIDALRQRYGRNSIFRATFSHSNFAPIKGGIAESEDFPALKSQL